jgi:hypothetical protein
MFPNWQFRPALAVKAALPIRGNTFTPCIYEGNSEGEFMWLFKLNMMHALVLFFWRLLHVFTAEKIPQNIQIINY